MTAKLQGIGMTSQRTRDRLVARLREAGIQDERVLEVMRATPRHIFMDEALASRAYEDTSLPIGFGQTCLLYTSPSPRDGVLSRMPSSA